MIHVPTLISRKRDGETLTAGEIRALVAGYSSGEIPDYQMSAFAMAVFFRGMDAAETGAFTEAMMASGEVFAYPSGHPPVVDKHSTGGIGDKVSLVLAPLVACTGAWVPMVSGRGLGITGGTLDKMEAIPGFNVSLAIPQALTLLEKHGLVLMGQTERFCPADKKLYALRDVTGTVPSIPMLTASIMSKKLAESLDRLVLDVKYGSGAFMPTREGAEALAESMRQAAAGMPVEVHTLLTPMDEPLGQAVGNALEVIEAIDCLEGGGPADLRKLILELSEKIAGVSRERLEQLLDDGSARRKFDDMVRAQGGDPADLPRLSEIHRSPVIRDFLAPETGTLARFDAGLVGHAALQLGAGRAKAGDAVDHAVGFDRILKCGSHVHQGQPLCRIHARTQADAEMAAALLAGAVKIDLE